ncbi:MAG: imidazolonepropionase [Prevotella sp.]|nr:imidazolonepropionase [Prevotella sp.]MCM1075111.1 imidazolonepropionase [Ruminococcus sp.]
MSKKLVITNATITTPHGSKALKGEEMGHLHTIHGGTIIIEDDIISFVGKAEDAPALTDAEYIDAEGRAVLPGFVDSHTHLIFGGYRPDEFEWRLKGDSYMSIMERGGGIQSTVNATRGESVDNFVTKAQWFINRMSEMGVTTVEAKSGYGLDTATEVKMLDAIDRLAKNPEQKLRVVSTFLGAHAVPKEYAGRTSEYIDLMIGEMFPAVKGKATFCDIFTEKNVFEIEDSRRYMQAAKDAGFKLKFHADEIVQLGGAELAAELGAVSADHLLHVSDEGIKAMAKAGTVATLLPLTAFTLREPYAPARKFIDGGAAVALATDLNPGSCFSGSIPLTIALACIYMKMSIEETITALTLNGAAALDLAAETGSIEKGKSADLVILNYDNYRMLPYYVGMNCVKTVISHGRVVAEND